MRRTPTFIAAVTGTALLAGCSGAAPDDGALQGSTVGTRSGSTAQPSPAEQDGAAAAGASGTAEATSSSTGSGPAGAGGAFGNPASYDGELRDGTWQVGDAGEVEFAVVDGLLELVEVRPADGWQVTDEDSAPDTIEIDFRRGPEEYEIEIEIEGGVLEIEIDQDIDPAEPGVFRVGDAATAEVLLDGGGVVLGEVTVSDGWAETSRSEESDEIELELRRDLETWELDVDLDDGVLEVEIDYEIEGTFGG